jgi:hypothetical protein
MEPRTKRAARQLPNTTVEEAYGHLRQLDLRESPRTTHWTTLSGGDRKISPNIAPVYQARHAAAIAFRLYGTFRGRQRFPVTRGMIIRKALANVFFASNNQHRLQTNGTTPFCLLGAQSRSLVGRETWSRGRTAGALARDQLYPLPSLVANVPKVIESVNECIDEVVMRRGGES